MCSLPPERAQSSIPAKCSKPIRKRDPEYILKNKRKNRKDPAKWQTELEKNKERRIAKAKTNPDLTLKQRRQKAEKEKERRRAKKLKKQEEMEHKQQMLEDIENEELDPMNIQLP